MSFQVSALVRDLFGLGGKVCDFAVGHIVDHQWRQRVLRKVVQEVTLDDLVGNGSDEVAYLVLEMGQLTGQTATLRC